MVHARSSKPNGFRDNLVAGGGPDKEPDRPNTPGPQGPCLEKSEFENTYRDKIIKLNDENKKRYEDSLHSFLEESEHPVALNVSDLRVFSESLSKKIRNSQSGLDSMQKTPKQNLEIGITIIDLATSKKVTDPTLFTKAHLIDSHFSAGQAFQVQTNDEEYVVTYLGNINTQPYPWWCSTPVKNGTFMVATEFFKKEESIHIVNNESEPVVVEQVCVNAVKANCMPPPPEPLFYKSTTSVAIDDHLLTYKNKFLDIKLNEE